jgi:hypothetical protein
VKVITFICDVCVSETALTSKAFISYANIPIYVTRTNVLCIYELHECPMSRGYLH